MSSVTVLEFLLKPQSINVCISVAVLSLLKEKKIGNVYPSWSLWSSFQLGNLCRHILSNGLMHQTTNLGQTNKDTFCSQITFISFYKVTSSKAWFIPQGPKKLLCSLCRSFRHSAVNVVESSHSGHGLASWDESLSRDIWASLFAMQEPQTASWNAGETKYFLTRYC